MKPLIQKLPLSEDTSFVCRTYRTPNFEVPWHSHVEYELIVFTEGAGTSFIGNYIGDFQTGDVFFLAKNLPHTFQRSNAVQVCSAIVLQFREDFWGTELVRLPECQAIKRLFEHSVQGLQVTGHSRKLIGLLLKKLEATEGFKRLFYLFKCLDVLSAAHEFTPLSTQPAHHFSSMSNEKIDTVFEFTISSFRDPISLDHVAARVGMSVPAFCSYFKKHTQKTYVNFLNEIRVGYACKLLTNSEQPIQEICYDSGYNSLANFYKQFNKVKAITPSEYRTKFKRTAESIYRYNLTQQSAEY